ncbi:MAG: hypothetical protein IPM64_01365 [Phycisphaerales bacterium]|nr:hypothetical protein [Phycisphaerales bacterium]
MNARLVAWIGAGALLILSAAAIGDGTAVGPAIPAVFDAKSAYEVVRTDDPVTLVVSRNGKQGRVRLAGLVDPSPQAAASCQQFTANLLVGEMVHLEFIEDKDTPERSAYCFRGPDGLFANVEIIRAGYGAPSSDKHTHLTLFRSYAERSQRLKKGLFADAVPAVGMAAEADDAPIAPGETVVYSTRTGQRYHKVDCEHLKKSKKAISLKEAKKRGLTPCNSCDPPK